MPRSYSVVSPISITSIADSLTTLPEKPKESYNLKEAITLLAQPIRAAIGKGYSHIEIAEMLMSQGIPISPTSLKAYLPHEKTEFKHKRKSKDAQNSVVEAEAIAATPDPAPAEEPIEPLVEETAPKKRRGRQPSTKTAKTAAKSKATPRTTATKGRGRKNQN